MNRRPTIDPAELADFVEYVRSFYDMRHPEVLYPMATEHEIREAVAEHVRLAPDTFEGDSADREAVRDILESYGCREGDPLWVKPGSGPDVAAVLEHWTTAASREQAATAGDDGLPWALDLWPNRVTAEHTLTDWEVLTN